MRIILNPAADKWASFCTRPAIGKSELDITVRDILSNVRAGGDKALIEYSGKYDGVITEDLKVSQDEISGSASHVPDDLKAAIRTAKANIEAFHNVQLKEEPFVETSPGVRCWRKNIAIEKVGLYIPGGSAPLFSTVLMLALPAGIAGCGRIIMCTPPAKDGLINPLILYAANLAGITEIFKAGGAQAIAAMAYGTDTIPQVYKIFGPGNQYVTKAKELVQLDGIAIDMPAGPSEVLVIADDSADPVFIAADLLSQAEHGPDSQVVMVTTSKTILTAVSDQIEEQLHILPRKDIAAKALTHSQLILMDSLHDCIEFSNLYAPEHLIISTSDPSGLAGRVRNAGSVFLGRYSCESAGDYATGTNHTLPTNRNARCYGGVSTMSFMKSITFQEISAQGLMTLGPVIEKMAEAEMLTAHRNAVSLRLKSLNNE